MDVLTQDPENIHDQEALRSGFAHKLVPLPVSDNAARSSAAEAH
jgi:hypothetical protein